MCLPKQHIQGSCLGVPPAAVLNKLFVLVRKSQHSRIQSSQQHTKIRKFAAVCPAPSIFLPSMRLARERLVWEAADGQLCTNTGFPLHRTSLPELCAWKHTTGPRVSPKNRLHQWRKANWRAVFHKKTRIATQSWEVWRACWNYADSAPLPKPSLCFRCKFPPGPLASVDRLRFGEHSKGEEGSEGT